MYRISILLFFTMVLLASCGKEEFPLNSSSFTIPEDDGTTLIYEGVKAGEFPEAAHKMDWRGIRKLIVKGHVNNNDIGFIKRYISEGFGIGQLREVDLRDAEVFEDQLINAPFQALRNLEYLAYPRNLKSTGDYVTTNTNGTNGSYWLREVVVPENVEIIGAFTFEAVSRRYWSAGVGQGEIINLPHMPKEKYQLPNTVKEMGEFAYAYYPYADLELPGSVEKMERGCFAYSKLAHITIPSKVEIVPDECFLGNKYLKSIELPPGLTSIGNAAFAGSQIEELVLPDNVTSLGIGFIGEVKLKYITWPKKLTKLDDQAMKSSAIEELRIPEQIGRIGESCFYLSSTKRLWFHKNIIQLGHGFINGMDELEEVHVAWTVPPVASTLFNPVLMTHVGTPVYNKSPDFEKVKLFVPIGSKQTYQNAPGWKKFQQIIEE